MNIKKNIYFIVEQDGEVERDFKKMITLMLDKCGNRVRAYLLQVKYDKNDHEVNVALCLMTEHGEDEYLLKESSSVFKSLFGADMHLDIIFINQEQEFILRKICCPFFISDGYQVAIPDFYLSSEEIYGLNELVACFKRKRLYGDHPDGYLLCDIKPSLIGQYYERGAEDINQLVLANRHLGYSLFPIKKWPVYVHVAIPLSDNIDQINLVKENNIKLIAWGELNESV